MADQAEGTQPAAQAANAEGTQPAADAANAGQGKYTDDDMAAAKVRFAKNAERDVAKARTAWERERLEALDVDSWDELQERLTGKQQAATELEKQLSEAKRKAREASKRAEAFGELEAKYAKLSTERNEHAMRSAVYEAARKVDAHEKLVFAMLVADKRIGVDEDGSVIVRGTDGEPAGLSLEKIVTQLVAENAALQRPSGATGAGSMPQNTGARATGNGAGASPSEKMRAGVADMAMQHYAQFVRK